MRKNSLFHKTRLQIAAWYAAGTATILILVSFYLYFTVRDSYWTAINREISSLGGTLHDALEPKLQEPGVISERVNREILPNLCVAGKNCHAISDPQRHMLGVTQQEVYYLRFYNLQGQVVARSGKPPSGEIPPNFGESLHSIHDAGQHYHRYSTGLTTADGRPWGFLQVGRSMKEFDQRLDNLQLRMLLIIPILMLFIILVSWWVAGRTMKPTYNSYAQMQQFTADAAHELRTPLTAIQTTVDLMKYYEPSEYLQQQQSLTALDRQTERLIQLAQDLLMLSRLGSLLVKIDPIHLERLLTNLVVNAIEHTSKDGCVTVVLERLGEYALLRVSDTGSGMSPEVQKRIFDRFYRVNHDRGRQSGGAGLGLAIVKSIVSSYGGTVDVKSELQTGSIFTIKLPL